MSMVLASHMMTNPAPSPTAAKKARAEDAKAILKAELKRRGMTYADLVGCLERDGIIETEANLRNKLSRGSFTAAFFLQCLLAIGCHSIVLQVGVDRNPPS